MIVNAHGLSWHWLEIDGVYAPLHVTLSFSVRVRKISALTDYSPGWVYSIDTVTGRAFNLESCIDACMAMYSEILSRITGHKPTDD